MIVRGEVQEMSDEKPAPPGFPLGKWVTEQRRRHENKELSGRRIADLAELPNTTDTAPENPEAESP